MKALKINLIVKLCLFLIITTIFVSCYKDRFNFDKLEKGGNLSPDIAVPAIYSNLSMKDVLNDFNHDNLNEEDGTHFLYLVYWNKVYSKSAEELFTIPPQNINTLDVFSVAGSLPYGYNLAVTPYTINYALSTPNNIFVDELDLVAGKFSFVVNSLDLNHNATINISIPSATLNGVPFSKNIDFIYGLTINSEFDLSGYKVMFDNSGSTKNVLNITYTVTLHGSGNPNNSPYNINLNESFSGIKFSKIFGDFKQISFNFPGDSIEISMFNHNIHGSIDFENPMLHFYATNSFGMPIRININNVHAINAPNDILVTGIPVPWDINAPSLLEIGQSATTEFHLTKSNSNISQAINISPQWFVADISGISNPSGIATSNFALAESRFDINAKVELPLYGKAWDFVLVDTVDLKLGDDIDIAEYVDFRINTVNGFPVTAILQLYFLDENNIVLDSMLTSAQQIVTSGLSGGAPDYLVYESSHKLTESHFEKSRLSNLKHTNKVLIRAKLATEQDGTQIVKIYSFYNLEVRVGVRAKFNIVY